MPQDLSQSMSSAAAASPMKREWPYGDLRIQSAWWQARSYIWKVTISYIGIKVISYGLEMEDDLVVRVLQEDEGCKTMVSLVDSQEVILGGDHSFILLRVFFAFPDTAGALFLRTFEDHGVEIGLRMQIVVRLRWIDLDVLMLAADMALQCRLRTVKLLAVLMRTAMSQHQILRPSSLTLHSHKLLPSLCSFKRLEQVQHHPFLSPGIRKPLFDPFLLFSKSQVRSAPAPLLLRDGKEVGKGLRSQDFSISGEGEIAGLKGKKSFECRHGLMNYNQRQKREASSPLIQDRFYIDSIGPI